MTENEGIAPDKPFTVGLRLEMEKGWHTYTDPAGDAGIPTKITWTLPEGFKAGEIQWPKARDFNLGPFKTRGYDGTVVLFGHHHAARRAPAGPNRAHRGEGGMACEVTCVPGRADLALDLPVVSGAAPPPPRTGSAEVVSGTNPSGFLGVAARLP